MKGLEFAEKKPPFLKLLPAFCTGITMSWYAEMGAVWFVGMLLMGMGLLLPSLFRFQRRQVKKVFPGVLGVNMAMMGCGGWITTCADERNGSSWMGHMLEEKPDVAGRSKNSYSAGKEVDIPFTWLLETTEPPLEKAGSNKLVCVVTGVFRAGEINPFIFSRATGKMIVYLRKKPGSVIPSYGARFLLRAPVQRITSSGNPGGFEYNEWCAKKGIYHQSWCTAENMVMLPGFYGSAWQKKLYALRDGAIAAIRQYIPNRASSGIAEALLIGYRYGIDEELNDAYTRTGVVHIIAISGMHLSMIFGMLAWLPIGRRNRKTWIGRNLLIAAIIWGFTMLAGGAPSIMRAALMLSMLLLSECISKRAGSLNTLLAAAFVLLVADPMNLWDIGFQLSFTAVGGLLLYGRAVSEWLRFRHPLLNIFWQIQSVSIAAQALTTPLVLYHFHQFPVLFLLTNMVAIPVSGMVLYVEILFCLVLWFPGLASMIAWGIDALLVYMNRYILLLSELSFCVADHLWISLPQVLVLYGGWAGLAGWLKKKNGAALCVGLGCLLLFLGIRSWDVHRAEGQRGMVVYQVPGKSYAEILEGRRVLKWYMEEEDSANGWSPKLHKRYVFPAWVKYRHSSEATLLSGFYCFEGAIPVVVFLWSSRVLPKQLVQEINQRPECLLVALAVNQPPPSGTKILPQLLVLPSGLSYSNTALWKQFAHAHQIPLHEVKKDGAFVIPPN